MGFEINEMSIYKKDYEKRVDDIRFQLVENWCLCKYCQLYCPSKNEFKHWIRELKTCINNIKFLDIKNGISKARILTKMLVDDYESNLVRKNLMVTY